MPVGCTVKLIRAANERRLIRGDSMQRFGWTLSLGLFSVLAAAVAAGCFMYLLRSPLQVEATNRATSYAPPNLHTQDKAEPVANRLTNDDERTIEAFNQAADAILSRGSNIRAEMADRAVGKVPLPRRRPTLSP
jgi:hypothetical protein